MGGGWSECFNKAIRAYLDDGVLPENGTVCADSTCKPFSKDLRCLGPSIGAQQELGNRKVRDHLAIPF